MTGLTDYTSKNLMDYLTGQIAEPALPSAARKSASSPGRVPPPPMPAGGSLPLTD